MFSPNVHKGRWSKHEDQALTEAVHYFQSITKSTSLPWNRIAENISHRTGIQCQARWTEALDPAVRKGRWHPDEDKLLAAAITQYGCCWIRVASMIPTRTQRQCRTRWNQIHSQQLKASSVKGLNRRLSNQLNTTPAPLQFNFAPIITTDLETSPTSPAFIDDLIAQYGSSSSNTSRSSHSPPPTLFPSTPENNLFIQQNLFPMLKDPNAISSNALSNFLVSADFDFLLNYNQQQ